MSGCLPSVIEHTECSMLKPGMNRTGLERQETIVYGSEVGELVCILRHGAC